MAETELDFCQLCGGYDTIQTYFLFTDNKIKILFHTCEKCCEKYQSETEIIKAYINKCFLCCCSEKFNRHCYWSLFNNS